MPIKNISFACCALLSISIALYLSLFPAVDSSLYLHLETKSKTIVYIVAVIRCELWIFVILCFREFCNSLEKLCSNQNGTNRLQLV